MLLTIFIIAGIVAVVGWLLSLSFLLFAKDLGKLVGIPLGIVSWIGTVTFIITGILLLIGIAFPGLGQ